MSFNFRDFCEKNYLNYKSVSKSRLEEFHTKV